MVLREISSCAFPIIFNNFLLLTPPAVTSQQKRLKVHVQGQQTARFMSGFFIKSWNDGPAISPSFRDIPFNFDYRRRGKLEFQGRTRVSPFQPSFLLVFIPQAVSTGSLIEQFKVSAGQYVLLHLWHALPGFQHMNVGLIATDLWLNKKNTEWPVDLYSILSKLSQQLPYLVLQVLSSHTMFLQIPGFSFFAVRRVLLLIQQVSFEGIPFSWVTLQLTILHRENYRKGDEWCSTVKGSSRCEKHLEK